MSTCPTPACSKCQKPLKTIWRVEHSVRVTERMAATREFDNISGFDWQVDDVTYDGDGPMAFYCYHCDQMLTDEQTTALGLS